MNDAVHFFAVGIGVVAGLRSMLAPAAVAWGVRLGSLNLHQSAFAFMESTLALAALSIMAMGELVADKVPSVPRRTALAPLLARMFSGGFCGACLCASANRSLTVGTALGAAGAVIGAFTGYNIRKTLTTSGKIKDFFVALAEDLVAIASALLFVSR